ncbi:hypothetical protein [Desulfoferula mesophila]|uniref:NERD domain-containing protein n=1 Tax=Desulfoferula mesophila TaxID=3058419 RepID=A0AAU9ELZ9_9BACT|nr:hypothetical protein FAK_20320 [Desulfoferula mesophilus]
MAYIFGYPETKPLRKDLISLAVLMAGPLVAAISIYDAVNGRLWGILSSAVVGAGLAGIMILSYVKLYPRSLQRVFKPQLFDRNIRQDRSVIDGLSHLEGGWFVFNDIVLELFNVEHLLIGKGGVFVLAKVRHPGRLNPRDGFLFAGDEPLEVLTTKTWRSCHLISILLRKWFKVEHLPQPILVAEREQIGDCREFDGIRIMDLGEAIRRVAKSPEALEGDTAMALAKFVKERYAPSK